MGMPLRRTPVVLALLSFSCDYLSLDCPTSLHLDCLSGLDFSRICCFHSCATWTIVYQYIPMRCHFSFLFELLLCTAFFFEVQFILSVNAARKMFRCLSPGLVFFISVFKGMTSENDKVTTLSKKHKRAGFLSKNRKLKCVR